MFRNVPLFWHNASFYRTGSIFFPWFSVRNYLFDCYTRKKPCHIQFLKWSLRPHPVPFPHRDYERSYLSIFSTQILAILLLWGNFGGGKGSEIWPQFPLVWPWWRRSGRWACSVILVKCLPWTRRQAEHLPCYLNLKTMWSRYKYNPSHFGYEKTKRRFLNIFF